MEDNSTASANVFTIGHSNHTLDHFLSLLQAHGVQVVVDARSQPYSKYATQFDHERLKAALTQAGVKSAPRNSGTNLSLRQRKRCWMIFSVAKLPRPKPGQFFVSALRYECRSRRQFLGTAVYITEAL
jgi:hypothetical protein